MHIFFEASDQNLMPSPHQSVPPVYFVLLLKKPQTKHTIIQKKKKKKKINALQEVEGAGISAKIFGTFWCLRVSVVTGTSHTGDVGSAYCLQLVL